MLKSFLLDNSSFTLAVKSLISSGPTKNIKILKKVPASFWNKNPDHALLVFSKNYFEIQPFLAQRLSLNKKRKISTAILLFTSSKGLSPDKSPCLRISKSKDIEKIKSTLVKKKIQEVIVLVELSSLIYPYSLHAQGETPKLAPHEIAIALISIPREIHITLGHLCDGKINEFSKTESAATENVAVLQTAASLASLLLESFR